MSSIRNPQEMRIGGDLVPNVPLSHAGRLNVLAGQDMCNMYNHATGDTGFSNDALMRPPSMMIGTSKSAQLKEPQAIRGLHGVFPLKMSSLHIENYPHQMTAPPAPIE